MHPLFFLLMDIIQLQELGGEFLTVQHQENPLWCDT